MNKCTFDNGNQCNALLTKECENCSFRKTKEELIEGRQKAKARIEKLPAGYRRAIKEKYYTRGNGNEEV